jgi:ribonuclease-3
MPFEMPEPEAWKELQRRIDYHFDDRHLLCEAMTHRSYANEQNGSGLADNERLEFLGDAVLDLAVGSLLLREHPGFAEGDLTRVRAEVVAEPSLAQLAKELQLGDCLLLGRGEERSGGRSKSSLLANSFEALLGAMFLDSSYERAEAVIRQIVLPSIDEACQRTGQDYKTQLQELVQSRQQALPEYRLVESSGPPHQRVYVVEVLIEKKVCGRGEGRSKKKAEQAAANEVLDAIKKE